MYDNLLFQNASKMLSMDICNNRLPGAILFSGPDASGKLTCALETARVLSCMDEKKGNWLCSCPSCLKHKALLSQNVLVAGPRDCGLEIAAAKKAFLVSAEKMDSHIGATRYLFIRSIRKLTVRFSQLLWQDSDKISKIASYTSAIEEYLEEIEPPRELPPFEKLEKICENLVKQAEKLESEYMYNSIPILQIRNISSWANMASASGTKVIVIEKADRMLEGVRNALLKILEEPPADCIFILTTNRRGAVMPTILSRVRTYNFAGRSETQASEIIQRVYHDSWNSGIDKYLETFLPVSPDVVVQQACDFYKGIIHSRMPDIGAVLKSCNKFEPRLLLKIFFEGMQSFQRRFHCDPSGAQTVFECNKILMNCYSNIVTFNQGVQGAFENLIRDIAYVNKINGNILGRIDESL